MITRISFWRIAKSSFKVIGLVIAGILVLMALSLLGFDLYQRDTVFKGMNVAGVYVGGMSRDDAIEHLRQELDLEALNSNVVLQFGEKTWELPLYRIGAYVDLNESVDQALEQAKQVPFYSRWLKRFTFQSMEQQVNLVVNYEPQALDAFLKEMQASIDSEPVNADIRLEGGRLAFSNSRDGWKFNVDEARQAILQTLSSPQRTTELNIAVTKPEISDNQMGKVITVDLTHHQLTLYSDMQVEKQYGIACGMAAYPTPKGTFKITYKDANPTWVNPGSAWAASMPPFIPPGPGNPLGTRALATSASGVFIHGTYSSGSIGTSASHGCIRMLIRDSEDLFPRVPVGIPVLIF